MEWTLPERSDAGSANLSAKENTHLYFQCIQSFACGANHCWVGPSELYTFGPEADELAMHPIRWMINRTSKGMCTA